MFFAHFHWIKPSCSNKQIYSFISRLLKFFVILQHD